MHCQTYINHVYQFKRRNRHPFQIYTRIAIAYPHLMSATSHWAVGLPHPHSNTLILLASSWKHSHAVLRLLQGKATIQLPLAKPDLTGWLKLYDSESLLQDELFEYLQNELGSLVDLSQLEALNHPSGSQSPEAITHFLSQVAELNADQLPDGDGYAFSLPMAFMILVWMPCLALYGDYPPALMQQARDGDLDTICDLIKLDRSVIFDAEISQIIHAWTLKMQDVKLKRIGDAFRKGIPHISKKRIKLAWAQYVYDASKSFGMPLTAPKVRELFDALSQDAGTGAHDPDLAEMTDDAFYQAIAKRKKPLSNILKYRQA